MPASFYSLLNTCIFACCKRKRLAAVYLANLDTDVSCQAMSVFCAQGDVAMLSRSLKRLRFLRAGRDEDAIKKQGSDTDNFDV